MALALRPRKDGGETTGYTYLGPTRFALGLPTPLLIKFPFPKRGLNYGIP